MARLSKAKIEFRKKTGFRNSVEFARYIREEIAEELYGSIKHRKAS